MATICGIKSSRTVQQGFTLLELAVVVAIIAILAGVALDRYYKLLIDVERTSVQHDLGVMRSAIGMQVAERYVAGDIAGIEALAGTNPMDLLAEKPNNYKGVVGTKSLQEVEAGSWLYDAETSQLIYLVKNKQFFYSDLEEPERIRFTIQPVYSEKVIKGETRRHIAGLTLESLEPYGWRSPWKKREK